jgi:hypothetical protein
MDFRGWFVKFIKDVRQKDRLMGPNEVGDNDLNRSVYFFGKFDTIGIDGDKPFFV